MEIDAFGNSEENTVNPGESATALDSKVNALLQGDWTEKYRASSIEELLLPKSLKDTIANSLKLEVKNMIFYSSSPGTGKTSTALVIPKVLKCQSMFFNASTDGRIGLIKDILPAYSMQKGVDGKYKIVIFDEVDGATDAFFESLRGFMESSHNTLRFILTCNNIHKIPKAISESRCVPISFNKTEDPVEEKQLKNSIYKKLTEIAVKETGDASKVSKDTITSLIKDYYPDIRAMINALQINFIRNNGIVQGKASLYSSVNIEEIWNNIVNGNWEEAQRIYFSKVSDPDTFFRELLDYSLPLIDRKFRASVASIIGEYNYRSCFRVDPHVNVSAMFASLCMLFVK